MQQHREFARHGHHGPLLGRAAGPGVLQRPASQGTVWPKPAHDHVRALHQKLAQIAIAALADAQMRILFARLPAPRHQTQKRTYLAAVRESAGSLSVKTKVSAVIGPIPGA